MARSVTSPELKQFQKEMEAWRLTNLVLVYALKKKIREWKLIDLQIRVEVQAFFSELQLFTLDGKVRTMDASNRIKALHDCLADILEINDSWFFECEISKRITRKAEPWCAAFFYPCKVLSLQEVRERYRLK